MRALLISDDTRAETARLVAFAKANPFSQKTLQAMEDGLIPAIGEDQRFICIISMGFRCVYSHEEQSTGWSAHLSVSVIDGPGAAVDAVNEIAKLFGFRDGIVGADSTWTEDLGGGRLATNLIQRINPADES